MMTGNYAEAEELADSSFSYNNERALFLRGTHRLLTNVSFSGLIIGFFLIFHHQDLLNGEKDLRVSAQMEGPHSVFGFYNMALILFYRGKIRVSTVI